MKQKLILLSMTAIAFLGSCSKPQESTDMTTQMSVAIIPMLQLHSNLQVGMSREDYDRDLASARVRVETLLQSGQAPQNFAIPMAEALKGYDLAQQIWSCNDIPDPTEEIACRDKVLPAIREKFPNLKEATNPTATMDADQVVVETWNASGRSLDIALLGINVN